MIWKPHVTVAAVIERDGRFLFVEEHTDFGLQFNQPAGHLEAREDFLTAVKREVYEETAWQFEPEALLSVQLWQRDTNAPTYLRFCFTGQCHSHEPNKTLDEGIVAAHWLSYQELLERRERLRSPLVLTCVEHYLSGTRYPLEILKSFYE